MLRTGFCNHPLRTPDGAATVQLPASVVLGAMARRLSSNECRGPSCRRRGAPCFRRWYIPSRCNNGRIRSGLSERRFVVCPIFRTDLDRDYASRFRSAPKELTDSPGARNGPDSFPPSPSDLRVRPRTRREGLPMTGLDPEWVRRIGQTSTYPDGTLPDRLTGAVQWRPGDNPARLSAHPVVTPRRPSRRTTRGSRPSTSIWQGTLPQHSDESLPVVATQPGG